jgi:hypothetical protein
MPKLSAWRKGVLQYKVELLEFLADQNLAPTKQNMLNGASNWVEYSYGGCSCIYDSEIAERLCSPSELKKRRGGDWQPSKSETCLDVQARALHQACLSVLRDNKTND